MIEIINVEKTFFCICKALFNVLLNNNLISDTIRFVFDRGRGYLTGRSIYRYMGKDVLNKFPI